MDTAAEALVRGAHYDEGFLIFRLDGFGLRFFEDRVGSLSVASGFHHCALGFVKLGRGDDFHGFGDFFDVTDGFEAAFNFAECGISGSIYGDGPADEERQLTVTENCLVRLPKLLDVAVDKLARELLKQRAYLADTAAAALRAGLPARESILRGRPSITIRRDNWPSDDLQKMIVE